MKQTGRERLDGGARFYRQDKLRSVRIHAETDGSFEMTDFPLLFGEGVRPKDFPFLRLNRNGECVTTNEHVQQALHEDPRFFDLA